MARYLKVPLQMQTVLCGVSVKAASGISGCGRRRRPPVMEDSYKHNEYTVAHSQ